jgi:hypothetical protein
VNEIQVSVQCKSPGPDEVPIRFQLGNRDIFVEEIVDHWSSEGSAHFKVRADDGNRYILSRGLTVKNWVLDSLPLKTRLARNGS